MKSFLITLILATVAATVVAFPQLSPSIGRRQLAASAPILLTVRSETYNDLNRVYLGFFADKNSTWVECTLERHENRPRVFGGKEFPQMVCHIETLARAMIYGTDTNQTRAQTESLSYRAWRGSIVPSLSHKLSGQQDIPTADVLRARVRYLHSHPDDSVPY